MVFNAKIENGQLRIVNRREFDRAIAPLSGDYTFELKKKRRNRSNPQNSYYWGAVVPICREILKDMGYLFTNEHTHEFLKANFNTAPLVNEKTGEALHVPLTTTDLTTVQFEEYMERVRAWAWDFASVTIPLPGEQVGLDMG